MLEGATCIITYDAGW